MKSGDAETPAIGGVVRLADVPPDAAIRDWPPPLPIDPMPPPLPVLADATMPPAWARVPAPALPPP
jgi:hypothetical protein